MTTREVITEVVKKIGGLGIVETIKVTGTDESTKIEAIDTDKTVIIKANLKEAIPELAGEFGISSLQLLSGLLNFPTYKTEKATFTVKARVRDGKSTPEEFEFRDENDQGSNFRLMDGKLAPEQPVVADIKWDVVVTPTKSKLQEFGSLAGLCSQIDEYFSVQTVDGNLVVRFGEEMSSNHRSSMVLVENVTGELKGELLWPITQFLSVLKMADGSDYTVAITSKGALCVKVNTDTATYQYILPARRR